ncbi:MAG: acyl-CoA dehydratase activase-related protein, partial [Desulfobacterales bacterium]|nr:acyl-CoA dehydratase activase-related protein [Desulfobacterales bacterium]
DVDVLLLPRVVEIDGFLMCPNFRAFPDIVELNIKNIASNELKPLISPIIEIKDNKGLNKIAQNTAKELIRIFGFTSLPKRTVKIKCSQNQIGQKKTNIHHKDLSKTIAIIGHPYVLADKRLNNGVSEILNRYGYDTIFSDDVPFEELNKLAGSLDYFAKKMYWRSAREIIGAFLFFSQINRSAGIIHLAPFNCGIDALLRIELMSLHKRIAGAPLFMTIVCDEHTQRDHVVTRIEAFLDMIYGIRIN